MKKAYEQKYSNGQLMTKRGETRLPSKDEDYTIDLEALGKYFPNTPMLAAIVKVSKIMTDEAFLEDMKGSFKHKFAKKPEVIDGNMKALEMALKEVKKI